MTASDPDIAGRMIDAALKAGADAADAIVIRSDSTFVGVADRKRDEDEHAVELDLGLRVLIGQRQACVASSDPSGDVIA
ncbi:MAG: DNA gyrase modulator, partial [Pseudomonadota bacterium]